MTVKITGDPKEIAALVLAVQERQIGNSICGKHVIEDDGHNDFALLAADKDTAALECKPKYGRLHDITGCKNPPIAEVEGELAIEHAKRFFSHGTTGEHSNSVSSDAATNGSEWLATEQDIPVENDSRFQTFNPD